MATLSTHSTDTAHNLLDFEVQDQSGSNIGTVHSFWADARTGALEFVGVKTGWLFGHNHVMPVEKVEVDESARTVRVPYAGEFVKGAPSIDADAEISDAQEAEIFRYYGVSGASAGGTSSTSTTTSTVGTAMHDTATRTGSALHDAGTAVAGAVTGAAAGMGLTGHRDTTTTAATTGMATARTATGKDDMEIALTEEQLKVGKRSVDAGEVRLRKIVRTEVVNQPVEIRYEDVVIERVSADQVHSGAASDFKDEVISVPLTREEVVVQKEAVVTGAVRLHKTEDVETKNVSDTIRKEDVEVVRDGKTVTEGGTTTTTTTHDETLRK